MSIYTEKERQKLIEIYTANPILETVDRLTVILNKPRKSIIAKLVKEGIYEKRGYRDKRGQKPITKLAIVRGLESMLGVELTGLDKTPKETLKTLHTSIKGMYEQHNDQKENLELLETYRDMLKK